MENPIDSREPRSWMLRLGLVCAQIGLAALALSLSLFGGCGTCRVSEPHHPWIAGVGLVAYLVLLGAGFRRSKDFFHLGVKAAFVVHLVLVCWMIVHGAFCALCVGSAVLATLLRIIGRPEATTLGDAVAHTAIIVCIALCPSGILWGLTHAHPRNDSERRRQHERDFQVEKLSLTRALTQRAADVSPLHLDVFEMAACGYCEDFRTHYLPRLKHDFGSLVKITFHPASSAGWVKRTPTIVVQDGTTFEGLPWDYNDLALDVAKVLNKRNAP